MFFDQRYGFVVLQGSVDTSFESVGHCIKAHIWLGNWFNFTCSIMKMERPPH